MLVELGNDSPVDIISHEDGDEERVVGRYPTVAYLNIPEGNLGRLIGIDRLPGESDEDFDARDAEHVAANERGPIYTMPDEHTDDVFAGHEATAHLAPVLNSVDATMRKRVRRDLLIAQMSSIPGGGLPDHEAFVAVAHPLGFWDRISEAGSKPSWVRVAGHPGLEAMIADHYDCEIGAPRNLEDVYLTRYGANRFPPGAAPDPLSGFTALHTTFGRLFQALGMGGFVTIVGQSGVGTASSSTTFTLAAGVSHAANDLAGQVIFVGPNTSGTGSTTYGLIVSNTSGTTPIVTVDRWYVAVTPGGSAATTPNATGSYLIGSIAPASIFVALTTDSTAPSLGGTGGTQDAATIVQALTSEITGPNNGLIRKIAPIGQSGATWTATPVFTADASGSLPATIAKAAYSPSLVATNGALTYMTLVSPTAVMSASGDQLTLTWTWTMT